MLKSSNEVQQVIEVSLGWLDVISLFSGIASLVMGGLAIWLSITFYKMSDTSSKEIQHSSNNINNSVGKLEKMFDTMYSDTFGMVKDTVIHMREQVDRNSNGLDVNAELNTKINSAISESLKDVSTETLSKDEIKDLVFSLFKESKNIESEVKKNVFEQKIMDILIAEGEQTFIGLEYKLLGKKPSEELFSTYFDTLRSLAKKGIIENHFKYDPDVGEEVIVTTSPIRLRNKKDDK